MRMTALGGRARLVDRLDAARLEPFAHEGDTAPVRGLGAQRDQIGFRRAPVVWRKASDWSRSAWNGPASRIGASAPADTAAFSRSGAPGANSAAGSLRSGWALTPMIGVLSRAASRFSLAALSATSRWNARLRAR